MQSLQINLFGYRLHLSPWLKTNIGKFLLRSTYKTFFPTSADMQFLSVTQLAINSFKKIYLQAFLFRDCNTIKNASFRNIFCHIYIYFKYFL